MQGCAWGMHRLNVVSLGVAFVHKHLNTKIEVGSFSVYLCGCFWPICLSGPSCEECTADTTKLFSMAARCHSRLATLFCQFPSSKESPHCCYKAPPCKSKVVSKVSAVSKLSFQSLKIVLHYTYSYVWGLLNSPGERFNAWAAQSQ